VTTATTEPASQLRCPRCGANLARDQDWCLECGAAATTRILRPPSWKLAVAIVLGVVAAVVVAVVIVVNALSGDARRAAATPATTTAAAAPAKPAPAAPTSTKATTPTTASAPAAGGTIASWPRGKVGWTVVLATASSRSAADQRARDLIANGIKAGVLDASRFNIDTGGAAFVVFTGRFPSQAGAVSAEGRLGGRAPASVFVAQVSPR
jgi:septal ring-binding cell division protein DamX